MKLSHGSTRTMKIGTGPTQHSQTFTDIFAPGVRVSFLSCLGTVSYRIRILMYLEHVS
jgi:hypothetical protein